MKKETAEKAKRVVAVLTISGAIGLPIAVQDRSGYISSTGRSGYISSTGRAETTMAKETTVQNNDGTGTLGSGNLTASDDAGAFGSGWNWLGEII